jgi:peptide deformylase
MKDAILCYGDPRLRKKCEPITEITPELKKLAQEMIGSLQELNAIGLACPQIGRLIRMFVLCRYVFHPDGRWEIGEAKVYINPKILEHSKETSVDVEGCISVPGIPCKIERPVRIKVEYTDLEGQKIVEEIEGINARVILHENDHLNGVLIIDRLKEGERRALEPKLRELKEKHTS